MFFPLDWWGSLKHESNHNEMVILHHQLRGEGSEQGLGDRGGWLAAVHGVTKGQTWLSNWTTEPQCGVPPAQCSTGSSEFCQCAHHPLTFCLWSFSLRQSHGSFCHLSHVLAPLSHSQGDLSYIETAFLKIQEFFLVTNKHITSPS